MPNKKTELPLSAFGSSTPSSPEVSPSFIVEAEDDSISDLPFLDLNLGGFPSLAVNGGIDRTIEWVFGCKPKLVLKKIKDKAPKALKTFREIAPEIFEPASENHSLSMIRRCPHKELLVALAYPGARSLLINAHLEAASKSRNFSYSPNIPVAEFALIKKWKPHFNPAGYLYGDPSSTGALNSASPVQVLETGIEGSGANGKIERFAETRVLKESHRLKLSPVLSLIKGEHFLDHDTYFRRSLNHSDSFLYLMEDLLRQLPEFKSMNPNGKRIFAGAAWAVSSLCVSSFFLCTLCRLEPELEAYYTGINIPLVAYEITEAAKGSGQLQIQLGADDKHDVYLDLITLSDHINAFLESDFLDVDSMGKARAVIDNLQSLTSGRMDRMIAEEAKTLRAFRDASLAECTQIFSDTGYPLNLYNIEPLINDWIAVLEDRVHLKYSDGAEAFLEEVRDLNKRLDLFFTERASNVISELKGRLESLESVKTDAASIKAMAERYKELDQYLVDIAIPALEEGLIQTIQESGNPTSKGEVERLVVENHGLFIQEDDEVPLEAPESSRETTTLENLLEEEILTNERLSGENKALRKELYDLERKLQHVQSRSGMEDSQEDTYIRVLLDDLSNSGASVHQILKRIGQIYTDRVRFLPSAFEGIESLDVPASTVVSKIIPLITSGLDMLRLPGGTLHELKDIVPGEISANESDTVRRTESLLKHREFKDGSKKRVVLSHLYLSYRSRMYFEYDESENTIIIAYLGKHLPTAKSSTV